MPIDEILIAMVFMYLLSGSNRPYYGVDNGLKIEVLSLHDRGT